MKRYLILLFCIVLLGTILRIFYLGKTPNSLEWDEVALGYDAYSILKTGKDQFGKFLPNNFRSLDDYKPPLYVYLTIPSVAIFGLSEFSTRLPSAIFGIFAIILTYLLCLELFKSQSNQNKQAVALISSLFLAISPWHLQFSRAAFETNLSVTVTLAAVVCFLKSISSSRKIYFLFSAFFFGLALFSYHSTRVVTPLILLFLLLTFKKQLPKLKYLAGFFIIYAVFIYFFIPIATSKDAQIRFTVTNDLNFYQNLEISAQKVLADKNIGDEIGGKIFHNRRLSIYNYENFKKVLYNYLLHFSPNFLLVKGDAPLHHAPGFGMLYFFDGLFIIIGLLVFLLKYRNRRNLVLLFWLLVAPLPAAVTWQSPHSVRAEIILPTLQIFSALGLFTAVRFLRREDKLYSYLFIVIFQCFFLYNIGLYLHQYYVHTNLELSKNWLYGRKQAVDLTEDLKGQFDKVYVSLKVDMPYIFWLFYSKYSPEKYLAEGGTVSGGFADERNHFDKYQFKNFEYNNLPKDKKLLLVSIPKDFPPDAKVIKTIYYLDNSPALVIAQN